MANKLNLITDSDGYKSSSIVRVPAILFALISICIFFLSKDFFLFWDTIQFGAKHPLFYYDTGFEGFFLPQVIDSGHFPLFGMYLGLIWTICGKSLWISHLAMMPFVFFNLYYSYALGLTWMKSSKLAYLFPLLLLIIPQSITQFCLVSPDIPLLMCFLALLYAFDKEDNKAILFFSLLSVLVSNRGIMLLAGFFIWQLLNYRQSHRQVNHIKHLIPGIIAFGLYQVAHWLHSGWSGFSSDMSWAESFNIVNIKGYIKNEIVYFWRLMDYGMIIIWAILAYCIYKTGRSFLEDRYVVLLIILLALYELITAPFVGLMQHRYFLLICVLAGFICIKHLANLSIPEKTKKWVAASAIAILLTGNLWIYPNKIAQGWDSTLAHVPYYDMYIDMLSAIDQHGIEYSQIGTGFPMRSPHRELFLNSSSKQLATHDLRSQEYILWSNISNEFSDEEIDELNDNWKELVSLQDRGIQMKLYHNTARK